MITLNESEKQTIINALHTAADTYKNLAALISAESGHAANKRTAEQFAKQHREAKALADKLEVSE